MYGHLIGPRFHTKVGLQLSGKWRTAAWNIVSECVSIHNPNYCLFTVLREFKDKREGEVYVAISRQPALSKQPSNQKTNSLSCKFET